MATSRGSTTSRSRGMGGSGSGRLPPVRLAPRDELAAAARVALLRAARDLAACAGDCGPGRASGDDGGLIPAGAAGADVHGAGDEEILGLWASALCAVLGSGNLDGLAIALYAAGGPVGIDALFEAYAAACALSSGETGGPGGQAGGAEAVAAALSQALEVLAGLGAVEIGAGQEMAGLTVSLSLLGVWGMQDRLRAGGWHVPVLGGTASSGAAAVLAVLADYNADDGEQEITAWLAQRPPRQAAAELIEAASTGPPGMRGAAFAVLDRVGQAAVPAVRDAMATAVLRPHAAVWLREQGEYAELSGEDSAWLLVDLGAGLLEEADPADVVADLLPDLPPYAQAELVAGLWKVNHPSVTGLLTTLSDHHPEPEVAKAARKAAFKARSRT